MKKFAIQISLALGFFVFGFTGLGQADEFHMGYNLEGGFTQTSTWFDTKAWWWNGSSPGGIPTKDDNVTIHGGGNLGAVSDTTRIISAGARASLVSIQPASSMDGTPLNVNITGEAIFNRLETTRGGTATVTINHTSGIVQLLGLGKVEWFNDIFEGDSTSWVVKTPDYNKNDGITNSVFYDADIVRINKDYSLGINEVSNVYLAGTEDRVRVGGVADVYPWAYPFINMWLVDLTGDTSDPSCWDSKRFTPVFYYNQDKDSFSLTNDGNSVLVNDPGTNAAAVYYTGDDNKEYIITLLGSYALPNGEYVDQYSWRLANSSGTGGTGIGLSLMDETSDGVTYKLNGADASLRVAEVDILANGKNKLALQKGEFIFSKIEYHKSSDELEGYTLRNEGATIRFRDFEGGAVAKESSTSGITQEIYGNYANTARERGDGEGILDMKAYNNNTGTLVDHKTGAVYAKGDTTYNEKEGYVLFDSDKLVVSQVVGAETITGLFAAGGKLIIDLSSITLGTD